MFVIHVCDIVQHAIRGVEAKHLGASLCDRAAQLAAGVAQRE